MVIVINVVSIRRLIEISKLDLLILFMPLVELEPGVERMLNVWLSIPVLMGKV